MAWILIVLSFSQFTQILYDFHRGAIRMLMIAIMLFMVILVVVIHYEALRLIAEVLPRLGHSHRYRITFGVIGALLAHVVEICMFALAYFLLMRGGRLGALAGTGENLFADCVYFSFVTFTTVGYGDIVATGAVRHLAAIESLAGFVLITWTASYLFLEMQKIWGNGKS